MTEKDKLLTVTEKSWFGRKRGSRVRIPSKASSV